MAMAGDVSEAETARRSASVSADRVLEAIQDEDQQAAKRATKQLAEHVGRWSREAGRDE